MFKFFYFFQETLLIPLFDFNFNFDFTFTFNFDFDLNKKEI